MTFAQVTGTSKAQQLIDDVAAVNGRNGVNVWLRVQGDAEVCVETIWSNQTRGQGHASAALQSIVTRADALGVNLELTPHWLAYDTDSDPPQEADRLELLNDKKLSNAQLIGWYGRHGFELSGEMDGDDPVMVRLASRPEARYQPPTHSASSVSAPTATQAFKQWFGDSRVVDGNGGPLVLYHGTDANFTAFDARSWEGGAFFTTNRTGAQQYGSKVMSVYLSIENPLEVSPYDWHAGTLPDDEAVKADGYDGYVIRNHDIGVEDGQPFVGDTYVAFSPTQVKSAETNDAAFNTTNSNIRFSVVEESPAGRSVNDAALVSGSNAAIATLNRVMRSAGWEVEYIDMDLTAEKPKVDIRVNRDDGRFLIGKVDSIGRASFETFQRERSLRMDGSTKGRRPLSPMIDDTFLGRQKFEGARSMLRGMTNYLADNATGTIALSDLRSAWAGIMSAPVKQDATPAVSLSDAIASNAVAFHEDIPNEQWLANKVADVVEDGRNHWGVPRYMGPVTGRFSRPLSLPVSLLATVPGERGEQDAIRQESLDYINANWDTLTASQTPYVEVDPFGKAWVNEGNHRIMVAAERGAHAPAC